MKNHPYHLVDYSPWPITMSFSIMINAMGLVLLFNSNKNYLISLGLISTSLIMFQWWRDVTRESTFQGMHTSTVMKTMKLGMIMFIISEVLFFTSFFWSFFHSSLSPSVEIGCQWPPLGIKTFNPINIPALNTMILLYSGISITMAHHSLINMNFTKTLISMFFTVMLGMYFTVLQYYEYLESSFCISDSVYGSTFFMSTGFHGIHVIIGTIFIMISLYRVWKLHMSNYHHVGFEMSAWYWHFVDVVWMFLYISLYWWGS